MRFPKQPHRSDPNPVVAAAECFPDFVIRIFPELVTSQAEGQTNLKESEPSQTSRRAPTAAAKHPVIQIAVEDLDKPPQG